jgi:hypothetical protein
MQFLLDLHSWLALRVLIIAPSDLFSPFVTVSLAISPPCPPAHRVQRLRSSSTICPLAVTDLGIHTPQLSFYILPLVAYYVAGYITECFPYARDRSHPRQVFWHGMIGVSWAMQR